jgi:hypothetical protein
MMRRWFHPMFWVHSQSQLISKEIRLATKGRFLRRRNVQHALAQIVFVEFFDQSGAL